MFSSSKSSRHRPSAIGQSSKKHHEESSQRSVSSHHTSVSSRTTPSTEEKSVKISTQRLHSLLEYFIVHFYPQQLHSTLDSMNLTELSFSLQAIEALLFTPTPIEALPEQQLVVDMLDQFEKMLRLARVNHEEWFDFAASRNPETSHRYQFTVQHFMDEISKLCRDLQQPCDYDEDEIQAIFDHMVNTDPTAVQTKLLTFEALDVALKQHHAQVSRLRKVNSVVGQVKELGTFLKKTNSRISPKLTEDVETLIPINGQELEKVLIQLLKKLEHYVKENGPISIEMSSMSHDSAHSGSGQDYIRITASSRNNSQDSSDGEPAPKLARTSFSFGGRQPSFFGGSSSTKSNNQKSFTGNLVKSISTSFRKVLPNDDAGDDDLDATLDTKDDPPPPSITRKLSFSIVSMKKSDSSSSKKKSTKSKPKENATGSKKQVPQNYDKRLFDSMSAEERQLVSNFMTNMMEEDEDDDEESDDGKDGIAPQDDDGASHPPSMMDRREMMARRPSMFGMFGGNAPSGSGRMERLSSWRVPSWNGANSTDDPEEIDSTAAPGQTSVKKHPVKRSRDTEAGSNLIVLLSRQVSRASFAMSRQ